MTPSRTTWALGTGFVFIICAGAGAARQAPSPAPSGTPPQQAAGARGQAPAPNARAGFSTVMEADGLLVQRRHFEAGNRTYWHSHEKGFLLLVERGRARTQRQGEAMRELGPGEVDYTPPGVMHWHGAAAKEEFIQVGVSFGGGITFTDPVTDAQYNGK